MKKSDPSTKRAAPPIANQEKDKPSHTLEIMKSRALKLFLILITTFPAHAKLAAWFPLDESPSAGATVAENIAGSPVTLLGFDADPATSFIGRGHPSASPALGTSYLLTKGGALDLGMGAAVQPTDQFTISFYYQPSTLDAFDRILESQSTNANTQDGIRIDTGGTGDRVRVLIRSNAAANTQITHPTPLKNDGTWYFCAVRYDSTLGDGSALQLSVVELGETPVDEAAITTASTSAAALNTGPISFPHAFQTILGSETADATGGNTLNAALDEFAFFDNSDSNGVLTDAQLASSANFGPSGVELITSFTTDRESVSTGNPATLSWSITTPFDTLTLDDGAGNITDLAPLTTAGTGTTMVTPTETTTYYLKGIKEDVQNVHVLKLIAGAAPEITSFASSASIVNTGESIDLSWSAIGAESLTLNPGAVDVLALTTIPRTVSETTTYSLSATNSFGTSTAEVTVTVNNGPIPTHSHLASFPDNTTASWIDQIGGKNINLSGVLQDVPLTTASPNTNLTGSFLSGGGPVGGSAAAYQFPDASFEIWFRPESLSADHQVIFETGGGQNGISALINEDGLRFIGSAGNVRTLDLVVPLTGINLTDFAHLVFSLSSDADTFEASLRDTFGATVSASEFADVVFGGNGATIFNYGSGGFGGNSVNLGGKTELADTDPAGLSSFIGEIAIFNVFDHILSSEEINQAFVSVAPNVIPQTGEKNTITNITYDGGNAVELTWNSLPGITYDAEFSSSMEEWFPLEQIIEATAVKTTNAFAIPSNQDRFFLRIIEVTP